MTFPDEPAAILEQLLAHVRQGAADDEPVGGDARAVLGAVARALADLAAGDHAARDADDEALLDGLAPDFAEPTPALANFQLPVEEPTDLPPETAFWASAPLPGDPRRRFELEFRTAPADPPRRLVPLTVETGRDDTGPVPAVVIRLRPARRDFAALDGLDRLQLTVRGEDERARLAFTEALLDPGAAVTGRALDADGIPGPAVPLGLEPAGLAPAEQLLRPRQRAWTGALLLRQFLAHPGTLCHVRLKGLANLIRAGAHAVEVTVGTRAWLGLPAPRPDQLLPNCVSAVNRLRHAAEIEVDHTRPDCLLPAEPGYCPLAVEEVRWLGTDGRWWPALPLAGARHPYDGPPCRVYYGTTRSPGAPAGQQLHLTPVDRALGPESPARLKLHVVTAQACPEVPRDLAGLRFQTGLDTRVIPLDGPSAPLFPAGPGKAVACYLGLTNPLQEPDPAAAAAALVRWVAALGGDTAGAAAAHREGHGRRRAWLARLMAAPRTLAVRATAAGVELELALDDQPAAAPREPLGLFAAVVAHFLSWCTAGGPTRLTVTTSSGLRRTFPWRYQGEECP